MAWYMTPLTENSSNPVSTPLNFVLVCRLAEILERGISVGLGFLDIKFFLSPVAQWHKSAQYQDVLGHLPTT